jgi:peptide deformylase
MQTTIEIYGASDKLLTQTKDLDKDTVGDVSSLVQHMYEVMYQQQAVGLAANQIGLGLNLFVMDTTNNDKTTGHKLALINPVIKSLEGDRITGPEGCLSFPKFVLYIPRHTAVTVSYLNKNFESCELTTTDPLTARCIVHEIEHLSGKTFIDTLPRHERRKAYKLWKNSKRTT